MLILDSHNSYLTAEFDDFCKLNTIICLCIPAHTSQLLQPLNINIFRLFKGEYRKFLEERIHSDNNYIDKKDFLPLYPDTRAKAFTSANIYSRFAETGLKLFNQERVLSKLTFQLCTPTPPPTESSISSAFQTPQNTRQLDQKIHSLQNSLSTKQKLSSSPIAYLYYLEKTAQMAMHTNLLLQQEIKFLRAENKHKYKKKAKRRTKLDNNLFLSI